MDCLFPSTVSETLEILEVLEYFKKYLEIFLFIQYCFLFVCLFVLWALASLPYKTFADSLKTSSAFSISNHVQS